MNGDGATLIDGAAAIEGKLTGKDARILGRFQGEVELQGRLVVGEGARVTAKVRADSAELAGEFDGELRVRSLVLLETARVRGSLDAQTLAVREGALVDGRVNGDSGTARPQQTKPAPPEATAPASAHPPDTEDTA